MITKKTIVLINIILAIVIVSCSSSNSLVRPIRDQSIRVADYSRVLIVKVIDSNENMITLESDFYDTPSGAPFTRKLTTIHFDISLGQTLQKTFEDLAGFEKNYQFKYSKNENGVPELKVTDLEGS